MTPNPLSPYAVSKLAGEKYCRVFAKIYGLQTIALRYFNVFGPRQDPNSQYSAVIPKFIKLIANNESPSIFGDGTQTRDFTYVKNVVEANILASQTDSESGVVMNCACNEQIILNDLIKEINIILRKDVKPAYLDTRKGDIMHSFANIDLIKEKLGYKPIVIFKEGIQKTVNYFNAL